MEFKVLIVGDKKVGKTTFVKRHKTGEFSSDYNPTSELTVITLPFNTSIGKVVFKVYDGGYPDKVDGAIIMFDLNNRHTFNHVMNYYNWLTAMFGELPVIVCGNRSDDYSDIHTQYISEFIRNHCSILNMSYVNISAKSNYNFEKPFLLLLRKVFHDDTITCV